MKVLNREAVGGRYIAYGREKNTKYSKTTSFLFVYMKKAFYLFTVKIFGKCLARKFLFYHFGNFYVYIEKVLNNLYIFIFVYVVSWVVIKQKFFFFPVLWRKKKHLKKMLYNFFRTRSISLFIVQQTLKHFILHVSSWIYIVGSMQVEYPIIILLKVYMCVYNVCIFKHIHVVDVQL